MLRETGYQQAREGAQLQADPALLAQHYRVIAGEQRRLGLIPEARALLAQARKLIPMDLKSWGLSAYLELNRR